MSNANNQTVRTSDKAAALFTDKAGNVNFEIVLLPSVVRERAVPTETESRSFQLVCCLESIRKRTRASYKCRKCLCILFLSQLNLQDC